uniref:Uncharacterized protein n=1 Tax=Octopus bimaculoides TaxID=37653 RepID=A0A0L8H590_OCTBM
MQYYVIYNVGYLFICNIGHILYTIQISTLVKKAVLCDIQHRDLYICDNKYYWVVITKDWCSYSITNIV